jgi:hypothetical protein
MPCSPTPAGRFAPSHEDELICGESLFPAAFTCSFHCSRCLIPHTHSRSRRLAARRAVPGLYYGEDT